MKMRGCEDEKMFYRPQLLEEPCAQTLSEKITPGHCVMEPQSTLLSKYSWKARSDLQTGLITKTLSVVTLAEKYPTVTEQSHLGQNENSLTPSAKKARASRTSSSGRCIEGPLTTLHVKLEATRWLNLV